MCFSGCACVCALGKTSFPHCAAEKKARQEKPKRERGREEEGVSAMQFLPQSGLSAFYDIYFDRNKIYMLLNSQTTTTAKAVIEWPRGRRENQTGRVGETESEIKEGVWQNIING